MKNYSNAKFKKTNINIGWREWITLPNNSNFMLKAKISGLLPG